MTYVFFVQLEPDIDHAAPIAYRLAKDFPGSVRMICTNIVWDIDKDHRIKYLREQHGVKAEYINREHPGSFFILEAMQRLLRLPGRILRLMPGRFWKRFYFEVTGSIVKTDWAQSYFRTVGASCIIVDEAQPGRNLSAINQAAHALGIPVVVIQTANAVLKPAGQYSQDGLAHGDYTIVPNSLTRWYKDHDPRIKVLGCMRYCAEWQGINSSLIERAFRGNPLPADPARLKVLIFGRHTKQFHQDHNTVRRVSSLDYVSAIFKPRPRVVVPRKVYELSGYNAWPSARLVQWADVVVCSITSVALDVLYYNKTLIYARYIAPDEQATYEDFGACWAVDSEEQLVEALEAIHQDRSSRTYSDTAVNEFFRQAVYAGDPNNDVLGNYARFLESVSTGADESVELPDPIASQTSA